MKKIVLTFVLCGLTFFATSQNASVEKSQFGIQTGLFGIWVHNESKLSNEFVLRSEIGLDTEVWGGSFYTKTGYVFAPVITLEPRWYYNLNKRVERDRRIDGNSGNFFALKTSYHPDWFAISNYDHLKIVSDFSLIPTWGIRRNIGDHFNWETGIGIGYIHYFAKNAGYVEDKGEVELNLHLRIGYRF